MSDHLEMLEELICYQQGVLLSFARRIIPRITLDDLMQPNDFVELENNPLFRYEEGVLHGLQMAKARFLTKI
jgi:hypothetical protein